MRRAVSEGDSPTFATAVASPVGTFVLVSNGRALTAARFGELRAVAAAAAAAAVVVDAGATPFPQARREFAEYFAGRRTEFTVPLAPCGTPFQRRVWEALGRIPHGATASYRDLARAIGSPRAARAVGAANRCNPLAILVPCHRVIGAAGTLGGYAGGVARKRALLDLEAAPRARPLSRKRPATNRQSSPAAKSSGRQAASRAPRQVPGGPSSPTSRR